MDINNQNNIVYYNLVHVNGQESIQKAIMNKFHVQSYGTWSVDSETLKVTFTWFAESLSKCAGSIYYACPFF